MALTKGFARNNAKTPLDQRLADMATIVSNLNGSPYVGVLGGANASIVSTTGTMNVSVAAAEFVTSKGKADGVMIFTNDGSVNVLIGAAPASNSRIDVIWVKHFDDTTGDTAGQFLPLFGVTAGVAAASPTKPAIPTGALELATLRIYSGTVATNGGANTLTNTYRMTAGRGGVVTFRTATERDAWTTPVPGQLAYLADVDAIFEWVDATIGWVHLLGKPIITAPALTTIYSAGTPAPRLLEMGGRVWLEGVVVSSVANFSASVGYNVGTIPVAKAPSQNRLFPIYTNGVFGWLAVDTAGVVSITSSVGYTGAMSARLDGVSWADKRLA